MSMADLAYDATHLGQSNSIHPRLAREIEAEAARPAFPIVFRDPFTGEHVKAEPFHDKRVQKNVRHEDQRLVCTKPDIKLVTFIDFSSTLIFL